jgi:hypothetical protein
MSNAAKGFKNWGQFVAAAHVSRNLNIPFAQLKAKMTGPTPMSLGQAVQSFDSSTSTRTTTAAKSSTVQTEVRKAESEAAEDLRQARSDRHR